MSTTNKWGSAVPLFHKTQLTCSNIKFVGPAVPQFAKHVHGALPSLYLRSNMYMHASTQARARITTCSMRCSLCAIVAFAHGREEDLHQEETSGQRATFLHTGQSINQSIYQSINQSSNRPVKQSKARYIVTINQSTKKYNPNKSIRQQSSQKSGQGRREITIKFSIKRNDNADKCQRDDVMSRQTYMNNNHQ